MSSNAAVIEQFYAAFAQRDAEAMAACYADDVVFADPVFRELRGERAKAMWRMLAGRSRDLVVTFRDVVAQGETGRAHWEAVYTFGQTRVFAGRQNWWRVWLKEPLVNAKTLLGVTAKTRTGSGAIPFSSW